jgi:hypothetical protein
MNSMTKLYAATVLMLITFGLGLGLGWKLWRGKMTTITRDVPGPAIILHDGGQVLEKKIASKSTIIQVIPDGAHVQEEGTIIFRPNPDPAPDDHPAKVPDAPHDFHINFALVTMADGSRRVVASSPEGKVVGGIDIVVDPHKPAPPPLRNSAGLVYGTTAWGDTAKGIFYDRDWKFIRAGLEVTHNTYANVNRTAWEGRIKVGLNF